MLLPIGISPLGAARGVSPLLLSLVSHWSYEEASGTRVDNFGANHLTDNNTVTQAAGKVANAAQFTNANSEYLSVVDNPSLSMGDIAFSTACWVYLDSKTARRAFICKSTGSIDATTEYRLDYSNSNNRFRFCVGNGTLSAVVNDTVFGSPALATWYFLVAWHDPVGDTINLQTNNGTVNSAAYTGGSYDSGAPLHIGRRDATVNDYMDGRIDEAAIAKRLWTAGERTFLYNAGAGRSWADILAYRG